MSDEFSVEKAKQFAILREKKEQCEQMAKLYGQMLEELGRDIFTGFTNTGMKNFRLGGTGVFADGRDRLVYPQVKIHATVANPEKFFAALHEMGAGTLIKKHVPPATLTKWVGEQKKKNLPLPPEDVLKVWQEETAKVLRAPAGAGEKETVIEGADENE